MCPTPLWDEIIHGMRVLMQGDNKNIVQWLAGVWTPCLNVYKSSVSTLATFFHGLHCSYSILPHSDIGEWAIWVPREFNQLADELSKKASSLGSSFDWQVDGISKRKYVFGAWDGAWDRESGRAGLGAILWWSDTKPSKQFDDSMSLVGFTGIQTFAASAQESELVACMLLAEMVRWLVLGTRPRLEQKCESATDWIRLLSDLLCR